MKRLTVPVALTVLLFVAACDQSATTSKPEADKPGTTSETKPAETPSTAAPADATQAEAKKAGPCADDRKKFCADKDKDEVTACLKSNQAQLSTDCRSSLKL